MRTRRMSAMTIRNIRYRTEHTLQYALMSAVAMFVVGLVIFDGDIRPAIAGFFAMGLLAWWLWRPGGLAARRALERIAQQEAGLIDGRVDWGPPKSSPPDEPPVSPGG